MDYMMAINMIKKNKLYGAILGDLAGQPYEFPILTHFPDIKDINLHNPNSVFTDDTLMTLATAKSIMLPRNMKVLNSLIMFICFNLR